jgi:hypothetical protein
MAYMDISQMASSGSLMQRELACAWEQKIPEPNQWVADHSWELASQPGWGDNWASARAAGKTDPGSDEAVISDGAILSAVQSIVATEAVAAAAAAAEESPAEGDAA